ncbi:translocation/assembly module TamB [Bacteroidales bacterium OttesenSCG-928-B11]|nr:translocation/assembly module TamB [Bacteroidales bacterium OttesenSCG-928-C03]MDL2311437.1 translocation/assembly module TamB [Bacteroidales bacterium OttesenSCG-928-B11]
MKRKINKKTKRVLLSLAALIFVFFLLLTLVFIPPIQNRIIEKVTKTLSENWESDFKIGKIYLTPTLKIAFEDLVINDLEQNPMIRVAKGKTRLKGFNFSPMNLAFHLLELDGAEVLLTKYLGEESINIGLWAKHLKKNDEKSDFKLRADRLVMTDSRFLIHNENTISTGNTGENIDYAFLELNNITFKTKDFQVNRDDISAEITKMSFSQYSGFELLNASAFFRINSNGLMFNKGKIATEHSIIYLDLSFDYDQWGSYSSFTDSVRIKANISPSIVHFSDIARFTQALKGMDQYVVFAGTVNGTINSMLINDFSVFFKETNTVRGSIYMEDITDFKHGYYDVTLRETSVNMYDLTKFLLPGGKNTPIPKELYPLGNTELEVSFKGNFNTFASKIKLNSQLGNATANLDMYETNDRYSFEGKAFSQNFNVGRLIPDNKILGNISFNIALNGYSLLDHNQGFNIEKSYANLTGKVNRFDLFNYPVQDISLNGMLNGKKFDGRIHSADTNVNFTFNGIVDLTNKIPNFKSYISVARFAPEPCLQKYPVSDSAKGLDRAVYLAQQNPDLIFSFDSLELNVRGDQLDNLNGFAGVDGILFSNGKDSIYGERVRLTSITTASGIHRFILTSNFLNATMSTNYQLKRLKESLLTVGNRYFPNIVPVSDVVREETIDTLTGMPIEQYFELSAETFRLKELMDILTPGIQIAPRSTCELYISSLRKDDMFRFSTRRFLFKDKFELYDLDISGHSTSDSVFDFVLSGDSIVIKQKKNNIYFTEPAVKAEIANNTFTYDLHWRNPGNKRKESWLSGYVNASNKDSIEARFLSTSLNINENSWHFNEDHQITIHNAGINFNNLILESGSSTIQAHGLFSFQEKDDLEIKMKNVDLAQFNNFAANFNLGFGGDISAAVRIRNWNGQRLFTGRLLVSDFLFNDSEMGNLFVTAAVPENTNIAFAGGLFDREEPINSATITNYTIRNYNLEHNILANLSGFFESESKSLEIKADIDTLELGFLTPFFKSFSQRIDGKAKGELAFYITPDSSYLDGTVKVLDGYLGIAPLNTVYKLENQDITFNSKGIEFPDVEVTDAAGNRARVTGGLYHQLFKNFIFDLNINTNRLLVLSTEKSQDAAFYGTGYVSGNVSMRGNTNLLRFSGTNLTTLPGTRLYLPVMFTDRVSETDGIRFKSATPIATEDESEEQGTIMDFNFAFDVTRDAEIFVELDPAIGGTLSARTEGTLQIHYNTESELTLRGLVTIASGSYQMSFRDLFLNLNMQLMEGGTVTFDGGIANSIIDAKALHRTTASVNTIDKEMPAGRTQVNAYLVLSGILMNPDINFEFEFPNLNSEENLRLNTAMNSANVNSAATQFFSLVLTSNFLNSGNLGDAGSTYAMDAGAELFSGILNNLFFSNIDFFDEFGVNIRNNDDNKMELSFQGRKTIDRWVIQGDIGVRNPGEDGTGGDGAGAGSGTGSQNYANNIISDFSVEYMINRNGNLRARAFVSYGNDDLNIISGSANNEAKFVAGGALIFKVDFNNGADIRNAFRRQKSLEENKIKK